VQLAPSAGGRLGQQAPGSIFHLPEKQIARSLPPQSLSTSHRPPVTSHGLPATGSSPQTIDGHAEASSNSVQRPSMQSSSIDAPHEEAVLQIAPSFGHALPRTGTSAGQPATHAPKSTLQPLAMQTTRSTPPQRLGYAQPKPTRSAGQGDAPHGIVGGQPSPSKAGVHARQAHSSVAQSHVQAALGVVQDSSVR
jgi:hypothetical protein